MLTMNDLYFCSDENTLYTMPELQTMYTERKEELQNEHEINNFPEWIHCITDFSGDMETMKNHEENMIYLYGKVAYIVTVSGIDNTTYNLDFTHTDTAVNYCEWLKNSLHWVYSRATSIELYMVYVEEDFQELIKKYK